ncbi:MAG: hypothetical protein JXQ83_12265 [Candidatus Glassbacteria bacterium]|nr:hypothetical protein [Candidatus Glassbacteria bacterium]
METNKGVQLKRRVLVIFSILLVIGLAALLQTVSRDGEKAGSGDDSAYKRAESLGTERAYRDYLDSYPSGVHARQAAAKLDDLTFRKAVKAGSKMGYQMYLAAWPRGRHAAEAKTRIAALDKKIASLKRSMQESRSRLDELAAELKPLESRLDSFRLRMKGSGDNRPAAAAPDSLAAGREEYSNLDDYNRMAKEYNALLTEYQPKYSRYKLLLDSTNTCIARINAAQGTR